MTTKNRNRYVRASLIGLGLISLFVFLYYQYGFHWFTKQYGSHTIGILLLGTVLWFSFSQKEKRKWATISLILLGLVTSLLLLFSFGGLPSTTQKSEREDKATAQKKLPLSEKEKEYYQVQIQKQDSIHRIQIGKKDSMIIDLQLKLQGAAAQTDSAVQRQIEASAGTENRKAQFVRDSNRSELVMKDTLLARERRKSVGLEQSNNQLKKNNLELEKKVGKKQQEHKYVKRWMVLGLSIVFIISALVYFVSQMRRTARKRFLTVPMLVMLGIGLYFASLLYFKYYTGSQKRNEASIDSTELKKANEKVDSLQKVINATPPPLITFDSLKRLEQRAQRCDSISGVPKPVIEQPKDTVVTVPKDTVMVPPKQKKDQASGKSKKTGQPERDWLTAGKKLQLCNCKD